MGNGRQSQDAGCGGFVLLVLAILLVVGAVISLAALVDPFDWMPTLSEVWDDCTDDYSTPADECDLATRFPGFWGHVLGNFAYVIAVIASGAWFAITVGRFRTSRAKRFSGAPAAAAYAKARESIAISAGLLMLLALLPIIVAVG